MTPNLHNRRARQARLGRKIGQTGYFGLLLITIGLIGLAGSLLINRQSSGYFAAAGAFIALMLSAWYDLGLRDVPLGSSKNPADRLSGQLLASLKPNRPLTPQSVWRMINRQDQTTFILNHLLLPADVIESRLSTDAAALPPVWQTAEELAQRGNSRQIETGHLVCALILNTAELQPVLKHQKISPDDLTNISDWLSRTLAAARATKPDFGGIGRDWAHGFTPHLNQLGQNLSLDIEQHGAYFSWLKASAAVQSAKAALSQGQTAIAFIGPNGVGKTSHASALAQLLLEEQQDHGLEHHQVISLNPSQLLADATKPGDMEHTLLLLVNEAAHAGHVVLFFDDAQLFFENAVGAVDISRVLLPVIEANAVPMIFAFTPTEFEQLKSHQTALANALTPITIAEPPAEETIRILEDTALHFEHRHQVIIAYEALLAAYQLSGRYDQDAAYPGRAIRLLEQAISYANEGIVDENAIDQAVEQSHGVKVGKAGPAEADELLNLENRIHERMVNQTRAVGVVANALRRARAGVANPGRPIGSFLFLGPTGVGKTELAKSIAATFFGAAENLIRLDMSEYQQPTDVSRLLASDSSLMQPIRRQPFSVVLLDEIEKAHPDILNLLLQLLDEGRLTDNTNRPASFKDSIIIATSNAGATAVREAVGQQGGELPDGFESQLTDRLINSGQFKPELLNRFDEIVVFRPLNQTELLQVVELMLQEINRTMASQNISLKLTPAASAKVVAAGYDARLGARPLRRVLQRAVEDPLAKQILSGKVEPGGTVTFDVADLNL